MASLGSAMPRGWETRKKSVRLEGWTIPTSAYLITGAAALIGAFLLRKG